MLDIKELFIEFILGTLFVLLAISSFFWIRNNGISDSTSIMALATIVYAFFTAFLFWNSKSSSEAQIRPFLYTELKQDMDLKICNKLEKNIAKNVKLRVRAIKLDKDLRKSRFLFFIHKYLWKPMWNPLFDYFKSYKENFEIIENSKSPSLIKYLEENFPIKEVGDDYEGFSLKVGNKKGKINLKILVHISYESLLDVKYDIDEVYYVYLHSPNVEIQKISN